MGQDNIALQKLKTKKNFFEKKDKKRTYFLALNVILKMYPSTKFNGLQQHFS